jgi:iron complex outermembrane recepter protein
MKAQMTSIPYRLTTLVAALMIAGLPADGAAQARPTDLGRATLEELLGVEVTSAGRRQQRAEDVAAAVYVITQDDIRRSGLTLLPEILRLAPGVQVAQVNGGKWAVSVRGFNSVYSNKLLVLVDGRSLYNRAFSGVFWDAQDLDIAEIERIEIVRGPGGAIWGSNAVNGIINIITRSAHLSTGGSATVSLGTFERGRASLRYGGTMGRASYRLYGQWSGYGDGLTAASGPADDRWQSMTGGYRLDWANATDTLMTQAHYTAGENRPGFLVLERFAPDVFSTSGVTTTDEISALGRWTRTAANGSVLQAQGSTTHSRRDEAIMHTVERSGDLDIQYEKPLAGQVLMVGGGYRYLDLATEGTSTAQLAPERAHIVNAFTQGEFTLTPRLRLTLGARFEHERVAGWGVSPSGRILWEASPRQRLWAAVSRARRTPSAMERTVRLHVGSIPGLGFPVLLANIGDPEHGSETVAQAEAGYRVRVGSAASVDLTVFHGQYAGLTTFEPQAPMFEAMPAPAHVLVALQFANLMDATTNGLELATHWSPFDAWRLDASYSALRITPAVDASSQDQNARFFDGDAPRHQWQARSTTWVGPRIRVTAAFYRVGALSRREIAAYTRLDANAEVSLGGNLTAVVAGRNLLTGSHEEFPGSANRLVGSFVPRSVRVQLRWQF